MRTMIKSVEVLQLSLRRFTDCKLIDQMSVSRGIAVGEHSHHRASKRLCNRSLISSQLWVDTRLRLQSLLLQLRSLSLSLMLLI